MLFYSKNITFANIFFFTEIQQSSDDNYLEPVTLPQPVIQQSNDDCYLEPVTVSQSDVRRNQHINTPSAEEISNDNFNSETRNRVFEESLSLVSNENVSEEERLYEEMP